MTARKSARLSFILALSLMILASSLVYTALATKAIQTTASIFEGLFGSYVNVTNSLLTLDRGFALSTQTISSSGTNRSAPVLFSSTPSTASNGVSRGDWEITLLVNTTSSTPINRNFTVTLSFNQVGSVKHFTLYLETGSNVEAAGQPFEVLCEIDIGPTLSSPYSFTFMVH